MSAASRLYISVSPLVMTGIGRLAPALFDKAKNFCHAADRDVDLHTARSSMAVSKLKEETLR
jgi:hypothetical protein